MKLSIWWLTYGNTIRMGGATCFPYPAPPSRVNSLLNAYGATLFHDGMRTLYWATLFNDGMECGRRAWPPYLMMGWNAHTVQGRPIWRWDGMLTLYRATLFDDGMECSHCTGPPYLMMGWMLTLTWILGVASQQLKLLRGRVGDSTIVLNSLSPQMSELVEDAIASWCGDIVGHFWLIRNGVEKLVELKFEFSGLTLSMSLRYFGNELYNRSPNTVIAFSRRDCAGFLFVGYWITYCVPCLGCFLVFIVCPIVPSIFCTICCVIFQIYIII